MCCNFVVVVLPFDPNPLQLVHCMRYLITNKKKVKLNGTNHTIY